MSVDYESVGLQTSKYFNVSAMAMLVADYFITMQAEIHWVCGRKWDLGRIIFTVSRYLPFAGVTMSVYAALKNRAGENCVVFGQASNALHIIGILAAEGLLVLRTYAFWKCSKKLLAVLLLLAAVCLVGAVTSSRLITITLPSDPTENDVYENDSGCIFQSGRNATLQYIFLMFYEMVVLSLMAYQRQHSHRDSKNSVLKTLYRDSMLYIACIILMSGITIIVGFGLPISYIAMLDCPQVVIHSILASRILFNLHECVQHEADGTLAMEVSDFRAGPRSLVESAEQGSDARS
ncbi:hypothetical protein BV22DRAFT_555601 [Leucogyrophana mollusca]|uniref:Uncharacterized protein n=1 Tax=Leucogyrophana mollusca TaxID=85980 RepID=A0ACB8BGZ8_9AGAM|nr:hypothetical protein BV22DRAFT_555601 [Leucogyrophana mollusca]